MSGKQQDEDDCPDSSDDDSYAPSEAAEAEDQEVGSDGDDDQEQNDSDGEDTPAAKRPRTEEKGKGEAAKVDVDSLWADFIDGDAAQATSASQSAQAQPKPTEKSSVTPTTTEAAATSAVSSAEPSASSAPAVSSTPIDSEQLPSEPQRSKSEVNGAPKQAFGGFGTKPKATGPGSKPPPVKAAAGGFGAVLGAMKKKTSVLQASADSWKSFKSAENLEEELQTHVRGKDGFIERQRFLERADVRQFELEKSDRNARRKPL